VFLQYLMGFRRLGHEVLFLDEIPAGTPDAEVEGMVGWLREAMAVAGVDAWSLRLPDGRHLGVSRERVLARLRDAGALLNVNGFIRDESLLGAAEGRAVFLDIDPGFVQMWQDLGLARPMDGHAAFVTVGTRVGLPDCAVPALGLPWIPTLPPVVLAAWPEAPPPDGGSFSSIASWRGPFGPVVHDGRTYGLRVHEFRQYVNLPRMTAGRFELVLDIDPADGADRAALEAAGWMLSDPSIATPDFTSYTRFIERSSAELCVAKSMYVRSRSGWFSDRSACYLATGRPVLAQDTGFGHLLPTGEGLLAFDTLQSATEAVARIGGDLPFHARAARRVAEEHLDSDIVLPRLLARLAEALPS
jgi:hypothetical protein